MVKHNPKVGSHIFFAICMCHLFAICLPLVCHVSVICSSSVCHLFVICFSSFCHLFVILLPFAFHSFWPFFDWNPRRLFLFQFPVFYAESGARALPASSCPFLSFGRCAEKKAPLRRKEKHFTCFFQSRPLGTQKCGLSGRRTLRVQVVVWCRPRGLRLAPLSSCAVLRWGPLVDHLISIAVLLYHLQHHQHNRHPRYSRELYHQKREKREIADPARSL